MKTSEHIKKARKQSGITQEELGKRLGVSQSAIAQFENGKNEPSLSTLRKIAAALGVYMNDLIDDWSVYSSDKFKEDLNASIPFTLSDDEQEHIEKYRSLDATGRQHVDTLLDWETARNHDAAVPAN